MRGLGVWVGLAGQDWVLELGGAGRLGSGVGGLGARLGVGCWGWGLGWGLGIALGVGLGVGVG